jgi:hypothetical protein
MSKIPPDKQFWDVADSFIGLANKHCADTDRGKVSAALLFAAARFNAFVSAAAATDATAFRQDREKAIEYFTAEFTKMLSANLDDWAKHFEKYMRDAGA